MRVRAGRLAVPPALRLPSYRALPASTLPSWGLRPRDPQPAPPPHPHASPSPPLLAPWGQTAINQAAGSTCWSLSHVPLPAQPAPAPGERGAQQRLEDPEPGLTRPGGCRRAHDLSTYRGGQTVHRLAQNYQPVPQMRKLGHPRLPCPWLRTCRERSTGGSRPRPRTDGGALSSLSCA